MCPLSLGVRRDYGEIISSSPAGQADVWPAGLFHWNSLHSATFLTRTVVRAAQTAPPTWHGFATVVCCAQFPACGEGDIGAIQAHAADLESRHAATAWYMLESLEDLQARVLSAHRFKTASEYCLGP